MADQKPHTSKLTDKQKRFAEEYLVDFNATQAAIRAGYSEKTANRIASENLSKLDIQEYIREQQQALSQKTEITRERVLAEYARIAFFDIRNIYDDKGGLKLVKNLDADSAAVIAGIKTKEEKVFETVVGETKEIKLHSKIAALEGISKILGFNAPEKQEVNVTATVKRVGYGKEED